MGIERKDNMLVYALDEDITAASVLDLKDEILNQMDDSLSEIQLDLKKVEMVDYWNQPAYFYSELTE